MGRDAEGTTVPVEKTRAEIEALLVRHGASHRGFAEGPDRAMFQFTLHDVSYRFDVVRPTVEELQAEYRASGGTGWGNVDWRKRVEREWMRRWRARLLWLKAQLEYAGGDPEEEVRTLLAHMVLPGGQTMERWVMPQMPAIATGHMPLLLEGG